MSSALFFSHSASSSALSRRPARRCRMQKKMKAQRAMRRTPPMAAAMPTCVVCESEFHFWLKVCEVEGLLLPSRVRGLVVLLVRKSVVSLKMVDFWGLFRWGYGSVGKGEWGVLT
jgi:hypothetical protein